MRQTLIGRAYSLLARAMRGDDTERSVSGAVMALTEYLMMVDDATSVALRGTTVRTLSVHDEILKELIALEKRLVKTIPSGQDRMLCVDHVNTVVHIMHYNQAELQRKRGAL